MSEHVWVAVLSSSFLSGLVGALVTGLYTLRAKKSEFTNEYFRTVLSRRIVAYEQVEKLVSALKVAVVDKDGRPYHLLFFRDEELENAYKMLFDVMSQALWLSERLFDKTRELNLLIFSGNPKKGEGVEFGKLNYERIAVLRSNIERIHASDMMVLHDVRGFLKAKKDSSEKGFQLLKLPY